MTRFHRAIRGIPLVLISLAAGCQNHTQEGALFGGLFGAGAGAVVGQACGNPLAGAAVGAVAGTATGAAIGAQDDEIDSRNRAIIAQQMGRQLQAGAVRIEDVVNMTKAKVSDDLIINQVRKHGIARPVETNDIIYMQQQGVTAPVVATMQAATVPTTQQTVVVQEVAPQPVIVETYWAPHPPRHHWGPGPGPW